MLVFTSSVNKSEVYSELLNKKGIPHTVLNAKNHEKAEIIADAGKLKSIIITKAFLVEELILNWEKKLNNNDKDMKLLKITLKN